MHAHADIMHILSIHVQLQNGETVDHLFLIQLKWLHAKLIEAPTLILT